MKKDKQKSDVLGEKERVCGICEKALRSGKALGGHMRSHVMKKKKKDCERDMMMKKCSECGKKFPSMKSLFGHMRCHPERDWRGINPPSLTESLRGWPLTAKRRRNPMLDHRLRNAVNFLIKVNQIGAQGGGLNNNNKKKKKKKKLCDLNLLENDKNDDNHTNLLDFDLNEMPPSISS